MLVALAVIAGGVYFVGTWAVDKISDQFSSAEDYPGPGHGKVTFQVKKGDTVAAMGRNLKAAGVVASVQAFIDAANGNQELEQHPGRLLPAEEGDGVRGRRRGPGRPRATW